jgi:putative oxidoreductase
MENPMEYAAKAPRSTPQVVGLASGAVNGLNALSFLLDLGIRLWVAKFFFQSGLVKISSWASTLALFENEYEVPLLPPELAAYLGTAAELVLPVLLVLGLFSRPVALALFVFNIIAVISYPDLSEAGVNQHIAYGILLLVTLFHGPGKISVDHFIRRRFFG